MPVKPKPYTARKLANVLESGDTIRKDMENTDIISCQDAQFEAKCFFYRHWPRLAATIRELQRRVVEE